LTKSRRELFIRYSLIFGLIEFSLAVLCLTLLKDLSIIFSLLISLIAIFYAGFMLRFWWKEIRQGEWSIARRFFYILLVAVGGTYTNHVEFDWSAKKEIKKRTKKKSQAEEHSSATQFTPFSELERGQNLIFFGSFFY